MGYFSWLFQNNQVYQSLSKNRNIKLPLWIKKNNSLSAMFNGYNSKGELFGF
jgi:hypothetical protein